MNRSEFQQLADVRIAEAGVLLANDMWDGAYYLAGYAVECGLKACILRLVEQTGIIFEDKKFAEKCWTHDIEVLVALAGLKAVRDADNATDPVRERNWLAAKDWNESQRYSRTPEADARKLYEAIT